MRSVSCVVLGAAVALGGLSVSAAAQQNVSLAIEGLVLQRSEIGGAAPRPPRAPWPSCATSLGKGRQSGAFRPKKRLCNRLRRDARGRRAC